MTDAKALNSLADLICRAQKQGRRTPMGIAMAIESARALPPSEKSELERLRQLVDAAPAELTEAQIEALAEAGNRFLNEENHEDLCLCDGWPEACVSGYTRSNWDSGAMEQALPTVIGLWESLRTAAETAELWRLRADLREATAGADVADELYRTWQKRAETAEARVAELESERHTTNQALADVTVALRAPEAGQAPDAELDESPPSQVIPVVDDVPVPVVLTEQDGPAVVTAAALAAANKLRRALSLPGGERA